MHTGVAIRLTEPVVMLIGGLDHERARARRRRAVRLAHAPPGTQSPSTSRPGSRASSPVRSPLSHEINGANETAAAGGGDSSPRFVNASGLRAHSTGRGGAGNTSRSRSASRHRVREPITTGSGTAEEQVAIDEPPPAMLRGLLTVQLAKPSRIKDITVKFKGIARTDWPEGIGSRRMDVMEETTLIATNYTFFSASTDTSRRAASIGPGVADGPDEGRGRSTARRSASVAPSSSYSSAFSGRDLQMMRESSPTAVRSMPHGPSRLVLNNESIDDIPEEPSPAYHSLVPSLPSSPVIGPSRMPSNDSVPRESALRATTSRSSNEDSPLRPPLSHAPSHDSTLSDTSTSSESEHGPGWSSAPVPGSTRSSFERGRPAMRRSQLDNLEESPPAPPTPRADNAQVVRPTYESFTSQRQSVSPALTERRRSSTSTSRPPPPVRQRDVSTSSSKRSGSSKPPSSRFSLAGVADVFRPKSQSRTRTIDTIDPARQRSESPDGMTRDQSRGRKTALKALRQALTQELHPHASPVDSDDEHADHHSEDVKNWREFRAGTYTYPIAIPVPASLPPTISSDFGHVAYFLKASVHRAGALTSNLHSTNEVVLVSCPGEDDTEDSESIVVERFWETQMKYTIILSGKSFPIGGQIPITIRLNPLAKVRVFRISALLEQKTTYYANHRKIARHEVPKKYLLMRIENVDSKEPLLPILSDDADILSKHPLAKWFINPTSSDDSTPSCLDPIGPWHLESFMKLPSCKAKLNFTTHHDRANISISHTLKIVLRVARGDDEYVDSKGSRKLWDVIVEAPIHILSCKCTQNLLPSYSSAQQSINPNLTNGPTNHDCGLDHAVGNRPSPLSINMGGSSQNARSASNHPPPQIATLEQSMQYARLVAGEETPAGEVPPSYETAVHSSR